MSKNVSNLTNEELLERQSRQFEEYKQQEKAKKKKG